MNYLTWSSKSYRALWVLLIINILVMSPANKISASISPEEIAKSQKNLERQLIAPCCFRQVLADHDSPEAEKMKQEIASMLSEGKIEQEIIDYYVGKYGSRILAVPPLTGFNSLSLFLPIIVLIIGLGIIVIVIRKWSKKTPRQSVQKQQSLSKTSFDEQIEKELKE